MVARVCFVIDCGNPVYGHGWCRRHYERWKRKGDTDLNPKAEPAVCSVDGCEKLVRARGWCNAHYNQLYWRELPPTSVCSVSGCGKPVHGHGWCHTHYEVERRRGLTDLPPEREMPRTARVVNLGGKYTMWAKCQEPGCPWPSGRRLDTVFEVQYHVESTDHRVEMFTTSQETFVSETEYTPTELTKHKIRVLPSDESMYGGEIISPARRMHSA